MYGSGSTQPDAWKRRFPFPVLFWGCVGGVVLVGSGVVSPARMVMTGAVVTSMAGRRRLPNRRASTMRKPRTNPAGSIQARERVRFCEW